MHSQITLDHSDASLLLNMLKIK